MTTSAYTRIHEAEVRHTATLTDADLTDDDRDALARWDAGDDSGARAIDAIFERFDPITRMWSSATNRTTLLSSSGSADTSGVNGSSSQAEVWLGPGKNLLPGALRTPCLWPHPPTTR